MACKDDSTLEALRNMTQCSICIETFNDPRVLPCAHVFCLKCLEKTQPKTKAKCALCRKPFNIPAGGLSGLPKNTMIPDLIELSKEPKSSENPDIVQEKQKTIENTVEPEVSSENIGSAGAQLPTDALPCGNCNNCEHCSRAQDASSNEEAHSSVVMDDQMKERSAEVAETPDSKETESLCDVCVLNNSDGKQKESTATLFCMDCKENQCEKCSAEHIRQRLCKHRTVVSLEDHSEEKLKQKEGPERNEDTTIFCDVCTDNNESGTASVAIATLHCIDCTENQCDDCHREHKRQRISKDHQIIVLDDKMKDKLLKMKQMANSPNEDVYCDICAENSENGAEKIVATWHCVDCNETQCDVCNREHKRQKLSKSHQCIIIDEQMRETLTKEQRMSTLAEANVFCDICKENNEVGKENIAATLHCSECKENQCEDCNREHKRQRLSKNHQIIAIDDKMKEKLLKVKELDKKLDFELICDICVENSESRETWSTATLHCLECDENHCKNCSKEHKKQSLFKDHEIIPIDHQMKNSISQLESETDTLCAMCVGCCTDQSAKVLKATLYCIDCQENQCEECNRSHLRQKQFREHQVITLNAKMQQQETHPRICSVHIKDKLKYYCFTCQQVICVKCVDKEHNSHEYQFACTFVDGFRSEIEDYLENIDSWLQQGEATKHELQTKYLKTEHVRNVSRRGERSCVSEDLHLSKEHQLNTELKKELDEHLASLSAFKRRCCGMKAQKSSLSICLVMNELRSKFEESRRQQELFSPERLLPRHAASFADCKSSDPKSPYYGFRQQMKKIAEEELTSMLTDEAYSKIRKIIERPHIKEDDIHRIWRVAFPYIIQRMRMWNGYVLTAPNIADLIVQTLKQKQNEVVAESYSASSIKTIQEMKASDTSVYPVSRLDCLTYLINIADCIVAHDILRIMSKFPMAIPLIIQDIREDDTYIVTVPIIQNTVIKWESTPGQIVENHLFTSPFRMIAAIRLGTSKIGKSTILNQLMSTPFMFSSKGEAGSRYGRPCTLDGAVEIVWLTQETCSSSTWKMMREYYTGNTQEVAILANLHGSALQHQETLKYLEKHVCSFMIFLMPGFTEKQLNQLKQCTKSNHIIHVLVDPQENVDEESYMNTIQTDSLSSDDTLQTLRLLLRENLNSCSKAESGSIEEACQQYESIKYTKPLQCKKSAEIVEIVRNHGCLNIKQLLSSADIKSHTTWNYNLKRLIKLSLEIISLQKRDAKKYLTYVETNLSQISASESMTARSEVSEANKGLRCIVPAAPKAANGENSEDKQIEADLKKAQQRLKTAMDTVDNTNLGQEHFFRTLGHLYENSLEVSDLGNLTAVRDLPNHFADLLINGHAIEMLNGDSGKIQLIWMKAICDSVLNKLPNLKVFVISIIGLQSSGKSTLLNALFSCRFAVSVGRCSRGLFMRMIFLDKTLKSSHGFDAIILIDTEGLSSPEKMNDPKVNQKDRLMATYAMGISNLTIVNILGEGMTEMTEILQIAIVAMARLRGGGIKPDILMIQHLQERNVSKIDQAKGQFCEAINKAFELISNNDVEIGAASSECLAELTARIQSGDLFKHFGPFKDGSSVSSPPSESYHDDVVILLETILKRSEVSENKASFERWCNHFESYWSCVQEENFALNFKNVKQITDFLYFGKKIAKVKELLDRAIRYHREIFSKKIRDEVKSQIAEKRITDRKKMLEDIELQLELIPHSCPESCKDCKQFNDSHAALLEELSYNEWKEDTKRSLESYSSTLHGITNKMLRQTFDGSIVRQGCFSEYSDRIAAELEEALKKRPDGIYSSEEQKEIMKNIWEYLQDIAAHMEGGHDLDARLTQTLHREYSGVFPTVVNDFKCEITVDHLTRSKAIKCLLNRVLPSNLEAKQFNHRLNDDQMNHLMSTINHLINSVFGSRCVEFSKTGLDFEEGMVIDIKTEFPEVIKKFEDRFRVKLQDAFKINLQMFVLQQFGKKMKKLQECWDRHNKPSEILKQKKQDYITEIEARLKSGFSSAGEGEVVASRLFSAVKKTAIQAGFDNKIQLIKGLSWTRNSETVRLCYFEELAKEVQAGNKDRALQHFKNPKDEIQKWYKQKVDSYDSDDRVMNIYKSTLKIELNNLGGDISNCTSEIEIKHIVQGYLKAGDDQYYSKLDPKYYDFEAFKDSIKRKLRSSCEIGDTENIKFPLSSDDSDIMDRLGCTEHCYWCGALCWGYRGHQLRKDGLSEMEAHHSCHQPRGLKHVRNRSTKKMSSRACHTCEDNSLVWFGEHKEDEGMLWSEAKNKHFVDWKFDVHVKKEFDELMRWFFQELNQDIATRRGSGTLPADEENLKEDKCVGLNIHDILRVVRNQIG